jgi:predicted RNA methylase
MFSRAQSEFNFYETPKHHAQKIYDDYNPKTKCKVIDICSGLGSLSNPWYDNGHDITFIELNSDFIPLLIKKYPKAKIIEEDFLTLDLKDDYDVFLCNPPFNTNTKKKIYKEFFFKILNTLNYPSIFYFICPKMFYKDQMKIEIEMPKITGYSLQSYYEDFKTLPAYYYFDRYGLIELDSNGFILESTIKKRLIHSNIIKDDFIDDENFIVPYFEFRYIGNIFDFQNTKCNCGIFKVNK